jgi:glycyl-tRNA synthetase (class II)
MRIPTVTTQTKYKKAPETTSLVGTSCHNKITPVSKTQRTRALESCFCFFFELPQKTARAALDELNHDEL